MSVTAFVVAAAVASRMPYCYCYTMPDLSCCCPPKCCCCSPNYRCWYWLVGEGEIVRQRYLVLALGLIVLVNMRDVVQNALSKVAEVAEVFLMASLPVFVLAVAVLAEEQKVEGMTPAAAETRRIQIVLVVAVALSAVAAA